MDKQQQEFVNELVRQSITHKQWLTVVRFGMNQLQQDQSFLFTLLKWEAERQHEREPKITTLDHLHHIMDELGLKFVVSN
jgi:hypothetical protein